MQQITVLLLPSYIRRPICYALIASYYFEALLLLRVRAKYSRYRYLVGTSSTVLQPVVSWQQAVYALALLLRNSTVTQYLLLLRSESFTRSLLLLLAATGGVHRPVLVRSYFLFLLVVTARAHRSRPCVV